MTCSALGPALSPSGAPGLRPRRGRLCPCPRPRGKVRKGVRAPRPQSDAPLVPQAGCRGRSPRRGYRGSPPVSKNVGGWAGGTTAHAKPTPPLKEGASQNKTTRPPSRVQGAQPPPGVQCVPRNAERKPHLSLKGGCREPNAPPGGAGGVPLYPKTLEGGPGGTTAHAKPIPPLKEGASHNKTPVPQAGCRGAAPAGGTACPPVSKNVGGWPRWDNGVRH